jgi:tetratricopeptide (TPR) repeat protein
MVPSSTILYIATLPTTLEKLNWLDDAVRLEERALELMKRVLKEEHPGMVQCLSTLATAYQVTGRFEEACALEEKVASITRRTLEENFSTPGADFGGNVRAERTSTRAR